MALEQSLESLTEAMQCNAMPIQRLSFGFDSLGFRFIPLIRVHSIIRCYSLSTFFDSSYDCNQTQCPMIWITTVSLFTRTVLLCRHWSSQLTNHSTFASTLSHPMNALFLIHTIIGSDISRFRSFTAIIFHIF